MRASSSGCHSKNPEQCPRSLQSPQAGYLHDPDASADDAGTTHAWAEVYLPAAGWIAFDPTHRRVGTANLVTVAVGRCNAQIMPIVGGFTGAAEDFDGMEVLVVVEEV